MIIAKLSFADLDCKTSLKGLVPDLVRAKADSSSSQPFYRFLGRMGSRGEGILLGLIDAMPEQALEEILMAVINAYEAPLVRQINRTLLAHEVADSFSVERLTVQRDAETRKIHLLLNGVNVNYASLVDNETVLQKAETLIDGFLDRHTGSAAGQVISLLARTALRKGAKAAHIVNWLAHHPMDRRCVQLLEMDAVKRPLLTQVEKSLRQAGIHVSLENAEFSFGVAPAGQPTPPESLDIFESKEISHESKRAAANAFAAYLKAQLREG